MSQRNLKTISLTVDPALICRILEHLWLLSKRKGNERGTAPTEPPESGAAFAYEPVDDRLARLRGSPHKCH